MEFFGLEITKKVRAEKLSGALAMPLTDDGATVTVGSSAAHYGVYLDPDNAMKSESQAILQYREIAAFPEIDIAIQDIVNEAIPHEDDSVQVEIILDDLDVSDSLKAKITESFKEIMQKLNFAEAGGDLFRRWYVDGRLPIQLIVDKTDLSRGIIDMRLIDSTKIKKIKEVVKEKSEGGADIIASVAEYFLYNENGFAMQTTGGTAGNTPTNGLRISADSIIFVTSGITDPTGTTIQGHLHKAIRPVNQLRMMEDSMVVYRIARAPERRVFYVDVGSLPKGKAEEYLKGIMNNYRNKMVYDAKTGSVRDDKKYMSMLEDFWLPRRDGSKGTEITTLPGAQNLGEITDVTYFQSKVYQALNIPLSRMQADTGFSLGRTSEVTRDELKFQKFIDKLRRKFSQVFFDSLKTHLILKGICNDIEWEEIKENIRIQYQRDNFFSELKKLDMLQARMAIMPQIDPYLGKYFSKEWVQKSILQMTDEDIAEMDEQIELEKNDPMAKPSFAGGMDPSMMGGDPSGGGGFPPAAGDPSGGDDQSTSTDTPYPFTKQ